MSYTLKKSLSGLTLEDIKRIYDNNPNMTLKEYVDGVIRITDDQILENVLTSIVNQLSREGFDLYEIEEYLIGRVKEKTTDRLKD
mgnify:CR=1 FL=1